MSDTDTQMKIGEWRTALKEFALAERRLTEARQRLGDALTPGDAEDNEMFHYRQPGGVLTVLVVKPNTNSVVRTYGISWADRP